ncbi:LysR family transcriptional regulator [Amycolatopsis magusensis]|uniref:LysR family transcriptional regulator n=1 Tax=Amycolatopsis magusensis TaxID=882444 RepID=UPI0024A95846|nr:LysR family transcriptional regulator [Amycolatopsis magusensis]MDI5981531.1 LysR family transcriptional regulator [Amycolatopsis magusensis]
MDTRLLRSFLAVVRTGNITAAAGELTFAQSTVTAHVQALERLAGTRLLDRHPAGATPTHAGTRLAEHARQLLDLEDRMFAEVADRRPAGPVRLYAPESVCAYRLPSVLREITRRLPEVRLTLVPAPTRTAVRALGERQADLALALEPSIRYSTVDSVDLGRQRISLVAPPDTPLPRTRAITAAELTEAGVLLLERGCGYNDELAEMVADTPPRYGGVEVVKRCVEAGLGLALLPTVTVAPELEAGRLVELRSPPIARYHLWLLRGREQWASPAVEAVAELLTTLCT